MPQDSDTRKLVIDTIKTTAGNELVLPITGTGLVPNVRSVSAGSGLNGGGDLSTDRTISMPDVGVAGTYGTSDKFNSITTDAKGRVTSIVPTLISILASQVSNFSSAVLAVVLAGVSFVTATDVIATDTIEEAVGKLQAQFNQWRAQVTPLSTGILNTIGNSTAFARANHIHDTVIPNQSVNSQTAFATTSTTLALITGFVLQPTVAGTYHVIYDCVANPSGNNNTARGSITKNGTAIVESGSEVTTRANGSDMLSGSTTVSMNGTTDTIDLRVSISAGTLTVNNRRMSIIRVGP